MNCEYTPGILLNNIKAFQILQRILCLSTFQGIYQHLPHQNSTPASLSIRHHHPANGEPGASADEEEFLASLEVAVAHTLVEGGGNGGGYAVAELVECAHDFRFRPAVALEEEQADFA